MRWINEADPYPSGQSANLEDVNDEHTVYLIAAEAGDDRDSLEAWLKRNFAALFEMELEGWYTDPELWPARRNYQMFREWFDPECHTVLIDTCDEEIFDDDA